MSKPYCGVGKLPKDSRIGTMRECAEKRQVRYYGIKKIDTKTIELAKRKDTIPETRDKLVSMLVTLRGTINRNKGRYEGSKDPKAKAEYYKLWQDAQAKLPKVVAKLKIIEAARDAEKAKAAAKAEAKEKSKSKTASKASAKAPKAKKTPSKEKVTVAKKSASKSKSKAKATVSKAKKSKQSRSKSTKSKSKSSKSKLSRSKKSKSKPKKLVKSKNSKSKSKSKGKLARSKTAKSKC